MTSNAIASENGVNSENGANSEKDNKATIDKLALFEFLGSFETPDGQWINPMEIENMPDHNISSERNNEPHDRQKNAKENRNE